MFRWPWVSRLAYDSVVDERDRLREQVAALTDSLTRIRRHEAGLHETPRPERRKLEPMPDRLKKHIEGFFNPSLRKQTRDGLYRRHARGESWPSIMDEVIPKDDEDEEAGVG